MADEITITAELKATNGKFKFARRYDNVKQDQDSQGMSAGAPSIGTTHEALAMGGISTAGWAMFRNLDNTNFIEIGIDASGTFHPFLRLDPGAVQLVSLGTNAPYAKADTAAARLDYRILEA